MFPYVYTTDSRSAGFADGVIPSGAKDGVNAVFILNPPPLPPQSLLLTLNGMVQWQSAGGDYKLDGSTVTFSSAPPSGACILAWYRY